MKLKFKIQSYQTAAMQAAPVLEAAAEKEAMFRNAGCFSDAVKINVEQIFIFWRPSGRLTSVNSVKQLKAKSPTEVTPSPIVTFSICPWKAFQGRLESSKFGMVPDPVMERVLVPHSFS